MRRTAQNSTAHGTLGIGPLAIGNIKYKTEFGLFQTMIAADEAGDASIFATHSQLARELNG